MSDETNKWPDKIIVGLTGNIATGKSAIMKIAAEQGALTLDADKVVHSIMNNDRALQRAIIEAFGNEVAAEDGHINRSALAKIVFNNPEKLARLEGLIHPTVRQEIHKYISLNDAKVVMIEAIKLLEGTLKDDCQQIWVAHCDRQRQLDRLLICRGMDQETAEMRLNAQSAQEEKVAQANVVIDTGGTMAQTKEQVLAAWHNLLNPPAPEAEPAAPEVEIVTRRARRSDVPGVLLHMHKASGGKVKKSRTDLLMELAERSFFIGQEGSEITTVIGWNIDSGIARVDQLYIHPAGALHTTGAATLESIEKSANEHFCELIIVFPPNDVDPAVRQWLLDAGYVVRHPSALHRVWLRAVEDSQPDDTFIMLKILRDIRIKS